MIRDEAEFRAAWETLSQLVQAYFAFRDETQPTQPKTFTLLAPSYTEEIAGLTEAVARYLSIPLIAVPGNSDVAIHLRGQGVRLGEFSAAAVGNCLKHFQTGISRIAVATQGRSRQAAREAKKATRFSLAGIGPGSVALYLSAQSTDTDSPVSQSAPAAAINQLVEGLHECTEGPEELPDDYLRDVDQNTTRYQVFKTVHELMPSDHSVEAVEIVFARQATEAAPRKIEVTRVVATRAKEWSKQIASAGIRVTESGRLRGALLDTREFRLTEREATRKPLTGKFPTGLREQVTALFDKRVRVTGILTVGRHHRMEMEEIEPDPNPLFE